jgi:hypothetical protein
MLAWRPWKYETRPLRVRTWGRWGNAARADMILWLGHLDRPMAVVKPLGVKLWMRWCRRTWRIWWGKGPQPLDEAQVGDIEWVFYALVSQSVCFHAPMDRENLVGKGTTAFRRRSSGRHLVRFLCFGASKCMFSRFGSLVYVFTLWSLQSCSGSNIPFTTETLV